jgi:hypothetical protein
MFWLNDMIARLQLQLDHSSIDIEDAMVAASEAQVQQEHEQAREMSDLNGTEVLLSGVAALMWSCLRLCMAVGHLLVAARRLEESEDKFRFCFIKRRGVVGASHPDTLKSQHALAEALFLAGKFAEAATVAGDCSRLRCASLGASHCDTLLSL